MKMVNVTINANGKRLMIMDANGKRVHKVSGHERNLYVKTFCQEQWQEVSGADIVLAVQAETCYSEREEYYILAAAAEECRVPTAAELAAKEEELQKYKAAIAAELAAAQSKIDAARAAEQERVDLAMSEVVAAFDGHRSGRMGEFGMSPDLTRALNDAGFGDVLEEVAIRLGVYGRAADPDDVCGGGYSKVD